MTSDVSAVVDSLSLVERLRLAQLPPPGERRAIREGAGATLREIAAEVGVSTAAVQRWESGDRGMRREHAIAYRRVLDQLREVEAGG